MIILGIIFICFGLVTITGLIGACIAVWKAGQQMKEGEDHGNNENTST